MKKFRTLLIALLCAGCVMITGCGDDKETSSTPDTETVTPENDSAGDNTETADDAADKTPDENGEDTGSNESGEANADENENNTQDDTPAFINKLTGLPTSEELADIRPVSIMINNIEVATPQQGISAADVTYEVLAEGGITRLLCVFTDYATLPETGSIRSSRDYFIDLADAHDAIYIHCGGSPMAYETLGARGTDNIDGNYMYRNQDRWNSMGKEHSMMTTGEMLVNGITANNFRTTSDAAQPFKFNSEDTVLNSGNSAIYAKLTFSYYQTVEFEYDEETGIYLKKQYGKAHIDGNDNSQLSFENAVILYCSQGAIRGDTSGRIAVNFYGDGDGYYMSNGEYKKIKWHKDSRTSSYTLYEEDGTTELLLNPGKTYVAIAPIGAETVFE